MCGRNLCAITRTSPSSSTGTSSTTVRGGLLESGSWEQGLSNAGQLPDVFAGGSGYLRLIEFNPQQDSFCVKTYSPSLDYYWVHPKQQFCYANLGIFSASNLAYLIDGASATGVVSILDNDQDTNAPVILDVKAWGIPPQVMITFNEPLNYLSSRISTITRLTMASPCWALP